jgi:hypothetical protein
MKIIKKSKTIFWLSVFPHSFRIIFYFVYKAEPAILESKISDKLKKQFIDSKRFVKIYPLTLKIVSKKNIEFVKEII